MRPIYARILLGFLAAVVLPAAANAYCSWWIFDCETYLVYDPVNNAVSGYSYTNDTTENGFWIGVSAEYDSPLYPYYYNEVDGFGYVEIDYGPWDGNGQYSAEAIHTWNGEEMGKSSATVLAWQDPTVTSTYPDDSGGDPTWTPGGGPYSGAYEVAFSGGDLTGETPTVSDSGCVPPGNTPPYVVAAWQSGDSAVWTTVNVTGYSASGCYVTFALLGSSIGVLLSPSPTSCGDQRDTIIAEYIQYGLTPTPVCSSFKTTSSSAYFPFSVLQSPDASFAILSSAIQGGGPLDAVQYNYNLANGYGSPSTYASLTITSAYRTPAHQNQVDPAHMNGPHVWGLAADIATFQSQVMWSQLQQLAHAQGACVEPQKSSTLSHLHADWRSPCPSGW